MAIKDDVVEIEIICDKYKDYSFVILLKDGNIWSCKDGVSVIDYLVTLKNLDDVKAVINCASRKDETLSAIQLAVKKRNNNQDYLFEKTICDIIKPRWFTLYTETLRGEDKKIRTIYKARFSICGSKVAEVETELTEQQYQSLKEALENEKDIY